MAGTNMKAIKNRIKSVSGVVGADELKLLLMELAQEVRA